MTMPPAPPAAIPQVIPVPGSRLEQLLDMRETARAAKKEAEDNLAAIDAGIKAEAAAPYPGQAVIDIAGSPHRGALRLRWHNGKWYVPAQVLKARYREIWDAEAKQERGYWQLHDMGGSGS
jgi:hypothetical protein